MMIRTTSSSISVSPRSSLERRAATVLMRDPAIELNIGPAAGRLDSPGAALQPGTKRAGPQARPFQHLQRSWTYQVPPLVAEQPPLSAVPVEQVRVVVPPAARASTKLATPPSRLDATVTV